MAGEMSEPDRTRSAARQMTDSRVSRVIARSTVASTGLIVYLDIGLPNSIGRQSGRLKNRGSSVRDAPDSRKVLLNNNLDSPMTEQCPHPSPLLSVVIPVHNGAEYVTAAIDSVLQHVGSDVEVIVVDDGSTDESGDRIRQFGDRVRYITQKNGGLASARNRGHVEARGAFVAWLDHDDINEPERLALQLEVFRRFPEVGVVSTGFSAFDENGEISPSFALQYYGRLANGGLSAVFPATEPFASGTFPGLVVPLHHGRVYPTLALGNFVHPPTVMMRREVWQIAGPLTDGLRSAIDWEFLVRASRHTAFAYVDHALLRYRRSAAQFSGDANANRNLPEELRAFELMLKTDPSLLDHRDAVRGMFRYYHDALANAQMATDRLQAMASLARGLRYGCNVTQFSRTALRIITPKAMMPALRNLCTSLAV